MQRVTVGDVPQLQPPPEMRTALATEPVIDLRALLRGRLSNPG